MKAAAWIDRVKKKRGWESDYRAAIELGVNKATISKYRVGHTTLDEAIAIKVADALGESAAAILLDQVAERTKNPALRATLSEAARNLCISCKAPGAMKSIAEPARNTWTAPAFH